MIAATVPPPRVVLYEGAGSAPLDPGERTRLLAALLDRGYYAPGIRWPTVPRGQERVRLTVSAAHTNHQIDGVVEALAAALRAAPTP